MADRRNDSAWLHARLSSHWLHSEFHVLQIPTLLEPRHKVVVFQVAFLLYQFVLRCFSLPSVSCMCAHAPETTMLPPLPPPLSPQNVTLFEQLWCIFKGRTAKKQKSKTNQKTNRPQNFMWGSSWRLVCLLLLLNFLIFAWRCTFLGAA